MLGCKDLCGKRADCANLEEQSMRLFGPKPLRLPVIHLDMKCPIGTPHPVSKAPGYASRGSLAETLFWQQHGWPGR